MSILQEAHNLVNGDRAATHGDFATNCYDALKVYNAVFNKHDEPLIAQDVPALLFCLKLARHAQNPGNRDNLVDAAGYLELYAQEALHTDDEIHNQVFSFIMQAELNQLLDDEERPWSDVYAEWLEANQAIACTDR